MPIQVSDITKSKINRLKQLVEDLQSAFSQARDQMIAIAHNNGIFLPSINKSNYHKIYMGVEEKCFKPYMGNDPTSSVVMEAIFKGECFPSFPKSIMPDDSWWGVLSGEVADEKVVEQVTVAMLEQSWWFLENGGWSKMDLEE